MSDSEDDLYSNRRRSPISGITLFSEPDLSAMKMTVTMFLLHLTMIQIKTPIIILKKAQMKNHLTLPLRKLVVELGLVVGMLTLRILMWSQVCMTCHPTSHDVSFYPSDMTESI